MKTSLILSYWDSTDIASPVQTVTGKAKTKPVDSWGFAQNSEGLTPLLPLDSCGQDNSANKVKVDDRVKAKINAQSKEAEIADTAVRGKARFSLLEGT